MLLNDLAFEIHLANKTWWHDPKTGRPLIRNRGEMLMLIVSEISEAMEGERKDLMDDKLPHRKMAEVELADALIRIFDYAGGFRYNLDVDMFFGDRACVSLNAMAWDEAHDCGKIEGNKGAALFHIVGLVDMVGRAETNRWCSQDLVAIQLNKLILGILRYAASYGYDMDGAIKEKCAYNRQRADHKPEARVAVGGKQW